MHLIDVLIVCSILSLSSIGANEDFYQLLSITKSATQRDIRRAFKRIALEKHPDKRTVRTRRDRRPSCQAVRSILQGHPDAHTEFVRINRAYEILRDDELRKKYDTYGEDGLKDDFNRGNQYQSWNFYQHSFGSSQTYFMLVSFILGYCRYLRRRSRNHHTQPSRFP